MAGRRTVGNIIIVSCGWGNKYGIGILCSSGYQESGTIGYSSVASNLGS